METSILVAVADGPDDIPLLTDESSQVSVCLLVRNSGRLASSDTGLGVVTFDGKLRDVVWPTGYSARRTADGSVLLDRRGHVIAHEGDALLFDAISSEGQPLWPCGDVTAIEGSAPPVAPTSAPTPSPAAPEGGAYPTAGPGLLGGIGQEATDGTFTLQMYTDQGTVWTGNAIDVHLQVGYAGPDVDVAFWSPNPAVIVGVEQLGGPHAAQGSRDLTCAPTSIFPGTVQDYAFLKSGGYEGDDPDGPWLKSYFGDPDLHLTPGWWRISAYFEGYVGGCGGNVHKLAVEMTIIVIP